MHEYDQAMSPMRQFQRDKFDERDSQPHASHATLVHHIILLGV
jgi:hypothetical protein